MAKHSLAAQPLLRNDIPILAHLFETSFDYFINHSTPFLSDYLRALRTLIGLGCTAALADRDLFCIYQSYFARFIAQDEGDFKANQHAKRAIAQCAAEMVGTATISFNALRYPRYYEDFMDAFYYTVVRVPEIGIDKTEAERIMSYLI